MADIFKMTFIIFISLSSGMVVASAVFAFIAIIGIVPSMAIKTNTTKYVKLYEEMIIFGGLFGCINTIFPYSLGIDQTIMSIAFAILFYLSIGLFIGVLASSLSECLDIIPIFARRANIKQGLVTLMLSIAIGKCIGSIIYFLNSGFQK